MRVQELLGEEIKGWKHAQRDLAKARAAARNEKNEFKLVRVKKDGSESKMHDATRTFNTEDAARAFHALMVKNNPKSNIKHNLYVNGEKQLLEGWKGVTAAVTLAGAIGAGVAASPAVTINGERYDMASGGSHAQAPGEAKPATVIINGEKTKVLYWVAHGGKFNRAVNVYMPIKDSK